MVTKQGSVGVAEALAAAVSQKGIYTYTPGVKDRPLCLCIYISGDRHELVLASLAVIRGQWIPSAVVPSDTWAPCI